MGRIRKVWILYLGIIIFAINLICQIFKSLFQNGFSAKSYLDALHSAAGGGAVTQLLVVLPVFLAVFLSELSSKSMQCVLGRGISRDKLILTKLLETGLLVAVYFAVATLVAGMINSDETLALSAAQKANTFIFIWMSAFRVFGYLIFSAMVLFLADSTAAGVIACVVFVYLFKIVVRLIEYVSDLTLYDYTFDGFLDWGYQAVEAGGIAWQFFPAILYVAAAFLVTVFFFRRKEFDF